MVGLSKEAERLFQTKSIDEIVKVSGCVRMCFGMLCDGGCSSRELKCDSGVVDMICFGVC